MGASWPALTGVRVRGLRWWVVVDVNFRCCRVVAPSFIAVAETASV
jgi:hypothetical protein